MPLSRRTLILGALAAASGGALGPWRAAAGGPSVGGYRALPSRRQGELVAAASATANWKVVYLVGAIDSDSGPQTLAAISEARRNASALRQMGMSVVEFYPPDNGWPAVVAAACDADVLVYSGHGVYWDGDTNNVGGFCLRRDGVSFVSPDAIRSDLRMRPGAIVLMNHACFSAGSSATDSSPIGSQQAQVRVAAYSLPFFQAGLSGYYASWYNDFAPGILGYLAQGRTLGQAYEAYSDFDPATVERYRHPQMPQYAMWLDSENWDGLQYNYAFAGADDLVFAARNLRQLVCRPATVWVNAEPASAARQVLLTVGASDGSPVVWTASLSGGPLPWLELSTVTGLASQRLLLTIRPPASFGLYQASLLVHSDDSGLASADLTVPVNLSVGHCVMLPTVKVGSAG